MIVLQLTPEELKAMIGAAIAEAMPKQGTGHAAEQPDKPVTTKFLCEYFGISEQTAIRWRKKKIIPYMQVGTAIRYRLPEVIEALEKRSQKKK